MKKLIVIKLGGSVITDKDSLKPKVRLPVIKRLAKEIGQIYRQGKYSLILVHGAGSFAHPLVKKFNLHLGVSSKEQKQALSLTHQQLNELNSLVLAALKENQVSAINFPPHTFITQKSGKLLPFKTDHIKKALDKDLVPVLFGDMVPDLKLGYTVISGDTIVAYLANELKVYKVIFLSDVDGIFDSDPKKNPQAKLIPEVTNSNLRKVLDGLSVNNSSDVTRQMKGKILELRVHLKGVEVLIANGLSGGTLTKSLGPHHTGSRLRFD